VNGPNRQTHTRSLNNCHRQLEFRAARRSRERTSWRVNLLGLVVLLLGDHLGSKASPFIQKPLAAIGVQNLKQKFKYSPRTDGVSAPEIGVRLMRPGRYEELGLTLDQARALGRDYLQALKEAHGDTAAREIGKRINEALR